MVATGHANLGRPAWTGTSRCEPGHRFPVPGVTALVTATAVLRLVAEGRLDLDAPANDQLRAVRLADDSVTVRDLLSHTGGVDSPAELYADSVPELAELMGPVIACGGPRGTVWPSNGGICVLGQLIADVTGMPYAEAAARLVLEPLGMRDSRFPATAADIGPDAVTCYTATPDGALEPFPARVCTMQAVAGLWSHRRGPGPAGHRVVVAAARGAGPRGAHPAGRTRADRDPGRPRLAAGRPDRRARRGRARGRHAAAQPRPGSPDLRRADQPRGHRRVPRRPPPAHLAQRLITTSRKEGTMYQPYPGSDTRRPETRPALIAGFVAGGVIAAAVWIVLAVACRGGHGWARITGTVLFGLATVDTVVGLTVPLAAAVKIWGLLVWLAGLAAVVLLWRRESSAYFRQDAGMIEVDRLSKRFGPVTAVDDLSFTVRPGRVTGFLGPNGAGKSTTMRVILGLDAPTSGRALVGGRRYDALVRPLREVGSLLDATALHAGRTAWAHLLVDGPQQRHRRHAGSPRCSG